MKHETYRNALRESGDYQTPARPHRRVPDRLLGWSDAYYYARLFAIVLRGSRRARQEHYTREFWIEQSLATWALVEACGGRLEIRGLEHLRSVTGPRVYISNHMSLLETFLLPAIVASRDPTAIVIKEELLHVPFFGNVMQAVRPISVTRKNPRQDLRVVLDQGAKSLAEGRSVLIFPQSTRTTAFDPAAFNSLGTRLADRAGVPILPIALKTDFMGIGRRFKDFGRIDRSKTVHITLGPALAVEGHVREAQAHAVTFIASHVSTWGGTVLRTPST